MKVLACTGHRPSFSTFPNTGRVFNHLRIIARNYLKLTEPDTVLTDMNLGFGHAVAYACRDRGIPFVAIIPSEHPETDWEAFDQMRYRFLVRKASAIEVADPLPAMLARADHFCLLWDRHNFPDPIPQVPDDRRANLWSKLRAKDDEVGLFKPIRANEPNQGREFKPVDDVL